MRRSGPIIILVIGVLALLIDFFPNLRLPDSSATDGQWRLVETKLGLDLEGGLRVEYQALPKDGVQPSREALGVIKDIIERRVNTTGVSEPVVVVQGDDRVGAVADTTAKLAEANINVTAAAATGAGSGRYGMILWVAPADLERAADALGA